MTPKEADIILLGVRFQTPNSGADYFRIKAKEGNHDEVTFYKDLWEAYQRIEEYVNTDDMRRWGRDANGNEVYSKQYLFLPEYTGGRMTGSFGSEHLSELKGPLDEFGKSLMENIQSNIKKEIVRITVQSNMSKEKPGAKSFSWTGTPDQLQALWQALIDAGYIAPDTEYEAFKPIFSGQQIDSSLLRVTWIKKAQRKKDQIAKNAVIALFDILANADKIPMDETINRAELFRKLEACFCNEAGDPLTFEHSHCKISPKSANLLRQIISPL